MVDPSQTPIKASRERERAVNGGRDARPTLPGVAGSCLLLQERSPLGGWCPTLLDWGTRFVCRPMCPPG